MKASKELISAGYEHGKSHMEVLRHRVQFLYGVRGMSSLDYRGEGYSKLVSAHSATCGDLWRQFWGMYGKYLYYEYVKGSNRLTIADIGISVGEYVQYLSSGDRYSSQELFRRVKNSKTGSNELADEICSLVRLLRGISNRVGGEENEVEDIEQVKRLMLYGLGFFMSFPLKDGEYFSVRFRGLIFSEWLWWLYESLGKAEQSFVCRVICVYRPDIREETGDKIFRIESGLDGKAMIMQDISSVTPGKRGRPSKSDVAYNIQARLSKLKNMKDWTADDFWNEMTYLYETCRTEGDWKSVKAILEMKARSMGIINGENQGGNTAVVLLTEKAVGALAQLGLSRKVVYEQ